MRQVKNLRSLQRHICKRKRNRDADGIAAVYNQRLRLTLAGMGAEIARVFARELPGWMRQGRRDVDKLEFVALGVEKIKRTELSVESGVENSRLDGRKP